MNALSIIAEALAVFACIATFLPYIRTDQWWVRIFDFPRMQLLLIVVAAMILLITIFDHASLFDRILIGLLVIAVVVQVWHIFPYTPIARVQVKDARKVGFPIRLFIANVEQDNPRSSELLQQIEEADPDIVLLSEMDDRWTGEMRSIQHDLPHTILHSQNNTYGLCLYSRWPLADQEVRSLVDPEIPSIRTRVQLDIGRSIMLFGVHPRPPGIKDKGRSERQDSEQRDAELVLIAREVQDMEEPFIIAGDFNDVAWSHTTRLFQRTSRALDPRVGRGFFNSFNAKSHFFRYPLDHLFHSDHFTLGALERKPFFGSDHFPMYVELNLEHRADQEQEAPERKESDREDEEEMLDRAAKKER